MADESRNPLELDVVVQKFAESAEALADVREQLRVLAELRETEEKANVSLQETAEQVAGFASRAADILEGLEEAQSSVAEVLKIGADVLTRSELKGMAETVKSNSQSISGVDSRVVALDEKVTYLDTKVSELGTLVRDLQTSIRHEVDGLSEKLENIHSDVREPVVRRLFRRMD